MQHHQVRDKFSAKNEILGYIKNNNGQETCIIRMFGITELSNSVAIHVHNFTPYFYVKTSLHQLN